MVWEILALGWGPSQKLDPQNDGNSKFEISLEPGRGKIRFQVLNVKNFRWCTFEKKTCKQWERNGSSNQHNLLLLVSSTSWASRVIAWWRELFPLRTQTCFRAVLGDGRGRGRGENWVESGSLHNLSNEIKPGCLVYVGDEKLPSYIGVIINYYNGSRRVLFVAHLVEISEVVFVV